MHEAGEGEGGLVAHAVGEVPTEVEKPGEEGLWEGGRVKGRVNKAVLM